MKHFNIPRAEALLVNHEACVATLIRQLFRTIDADDATGINHRLGRIGSYLENWHLLQSLETDQRWHAGVWWMDGISARPVEVILPNRLRMHGSGYMHRGDARGARSTSTCKATGSSASTLRARRMGM